MTMDAQNTAAELSEQLEAAQARIAELEAKQEPQWQPIETAPKETPLLLYCPETPDFPGYDKPPSAAQHLFVGWFGFAAHDGRGPPDRWVFQCVTTEVFYGGELTGSWDEYEWTECKPTHWRPLPTPPETV